MLSTAAHAHHHKFITNCETFALARTRNYFTPCTEYRTIFNIREQRALESGRVVDEEGERESEWKESAKTITATVYSLLLYGIGSAARTRHTHYSPQPHTSCVCTIFHFNLLRPKSVCVVSGTHKNCTEYCLAWASRDSPMYDSIRHHPFSILYIIMKRNEKRWPEWRRRREGTKRKTKNQ